MLFDSKYSIKIIYLNILKIQRILDTDLGMYFWTDTLWCCYNCLNCRKTIMSYFLWIWTSEKNNLILLAQPQENDYQFLVGVRVAKSFVHVCCALYVAVSFFTFLGVVRVWIHFDIFRFSFVYCWDNDLISNHLHLTIVKLELYYIRMLSYVSTKQFMLECQSLLNFLPMK